MIQAFSIHEPRGAVYCEGAQVLVVVEKLREPSTHYTQICPNYR